MKFRAIAASAALLAAVIATSVSQPAFAQAREKCVIAMSHYVSWDMLAYAKSSGMFKKWGDKYNVTLDMTEAMDYIPSLNLFASKKENVCAVTVTNMDAFTGPAAGGVDTTILVVQDTSNDNDGVLYKKNVKAGSPQAPALKDLVGKEVTLVVGSVSEYLLVRAFEKANLPIDKVKLNNSTDTLIGQQFAAGRDDTIVVTWHPVLMNAMLVKGAHFIAGSSQIPGEIVDTIAVHTSASENAKKAITGMWYELVSTFNPTALAYKAAMAKTAEFSDLTVPQIEKNLKTTNLFSKPADAVAFTKNQQLKDTMDKIRRIAFARSWLEGVKSVDEIGIKFPDGTTLGNPQNVKLRFDTQYMQMAADGKL